MAKTTEEVVTIFTADVSSLPKGQKAVKTMFDSFIADNRRGIGAFEQFAGTGGKVGDSLSALSTLLKGGAGRWAALGTVVGAVAGGVFLKARSESEKVREELALLVAETQRATSALSGLGRSSGIGDFAGEFTALIDQQRKLREMQSKQADPDLLESTKKGLANFYADISEFVKAPMAVFRGQQSGHEMDETARFQAQAGADVAQRQLRKRFLSAANTQTRAAELGLSGDTDEAKRLQLQLQKEQELMALKKGGIRDQDLLNAATAKYTALTAMVARDRENTSRFAEAELGIQETLAKGQSFIAEQNRLTLDYERRITAARLSGGADAQREIDALGGMLKAERERLAMRQTFDRFRMDSEKRIAAFSGTNSSDAAKALQGARDRLALVEKELRLREDLTEQQRNTLEIQRATEQATIRQTLQAQGYGKTWSQVMNDLRKEQSEKRLRDQFDKTTGPALARARRQMGLDEDPDAPPKRKEFGLTTSGLTTSGLITGGLGGPTLAQMLKKPEPRLSAGQMLQKTAASQLEELGKQTWLLRQLDQKLEKAILK